MKVLIITETTRRDTRAFHAADIVLKAVYVRGPISALGARRCSGWLVEKSRYGRLGDVISHADLSLWLATCEADYEMQQMEDHSRVRADAVFRATATPDASVVHDSVAYVRSESLPAPDPVGHPDNPTGTSVGAFQANHARVRAAAELARNLENAMMQQCIEQAIGPGLCDQLRETLSQMLGAAIVTLGGMPGIHNTAEYRQAIKFRVEGNNAVPDNFYTGLVLWLVEQREPIPHPHQIHADSYEHLQGTLTWNRHTRRIQLAVGAGEVTNPLPGGEAIEHPTTTAIEMEIQSVPVTAVPPRRLSPLAQELQRRAQNINRRAREARAREQRLDQRLDYADVTIDGDDSGAVDARLVIQPGEET